MRTFIFLAAGAASFAYFIQPFFEEWYKGLGWCPNPATPAHSHFVSRNVYDGNNVVVKFACDDGFEPSEKSADVLVCTDGESWRGEFSCSDGSDPLPQAELYLPRTNPPAFDPSDYSCSKESHIPVGRECKYIGGGFCGKIYEVFDRNTGERIALKIQDSRPRCTKPEEAFSSVIESQYVVPAIAITSIEEAAWILYPFITGGTLEKHMKARNAQFLTFERRKKYMLHMIEALHDIHKQRVTHMDVNASNMLISEGDVLKLADFGLANFDDFISYRDVIRDWTYLYVNVVENLFFGIAGKTERNMKKCFSLTKEPEADDLIYERLKACIESAVEEDYPWPAPKPQII